MLQETLCLLSAVPVMGLVWVSTGNHPLLGDQVRPSRIADPSLREDDDDFDEDEDEDEEELEEEELEQESEEEEEEEEEEDEDEM